MNEREVLHDFAVTQNRGGAFARFLRLIRFSHTIFALPFALAALVVSANGRPSLKIVLLVLGCMITARKEHYFHLPYLQQRPFCFFCGIYQSADFRAFANRAWHHFFLFSHQTFY